MTHPVLFHHGAVRGVTGSCHRLQWAPGRSLLVDCGLFQGAETSAEGRAGRGRLAIDFDLAGVEALVVTHVHIDHVGRVPHLLAAGFDGPILCSEASAELLPMVLEDALEIGFADDPALVRRVLQQLARRVVALPYGRWQPLHAAEPDGLRLRLQPAGHILGSAYVEFDAPAQGPGGGRPRIVFSGDIGPPDTPLLPDVQPPEAADVLVLESTYGDRLHENRKTRVQRLRALVERVLANRGALIVPAFSIGRTQEILYELEALIHEAPDREAAPGLRWRDLPIVLDSPLAADFTRGYARLRRHWDAEARAVLAAGRHPLDFAQRRTVATHDQHLQVVRHLATTQEPAIVIAASGMCAGGRVVNYLKALLPEARHDVLFSGYQAEGTPGRALQRIAEARRSRAGAAATGDEPPPMVMLDDEPVPVRAGLHTLGGYSAHADQADLLRFVAGIPVPPREVRLVHGDDGAKQALAARLRQHHPGMDVRIPQG